MATTAIAGQPTLVGFFISYFTFLLFYGPLSDRYGRRPLLLTGIGLFILASSLCAIADNLISMIIFRVLQEAGAASASTLGPLPSARIFTRDTNGSGYWPISVS